MTDKEAGVILAEQVASLRAENERLRERVMGLTVSTNNEILRLFKELSAVRACFAEASQDNAVASARIVELEERFNLLRGYHRETIIFKNKLLGELHALRGAEGGN